MALKSLLISATLVACVLGQEYVGFTQWPSTLTPGEPATLKWSGGNGPTTITLQQGDPKDLQDVKVLTTEARDGEFTWIPTGDLRDGSDYAFKITQGDAVNWSGMVQIAGGDNTPLETETKGTASATSATSSAQSISSPAATTSLVPSPPSTPSTPSGSQHPTPTPASSSAARTTTKARPTSSHSATSSQFTPLKPTSTMELPKHIQTGAAARSAAPLALGLGAAAVLLFLQ
ncbi:hypothetical protein VTN96DRAFT_5770 [Rasamsonia emersonii]|uniref:Yeast cell wall synthesis Kre9/Knh1-like N-terminal domain-containing protein n=1 Tax=Rasamsonia emersonii (strain ATCC 16479 / CBS 393.64 / IMI 116815) TaxID=1408163 RepID=A0A0F4Z1W0_RASE3|nr:hypothetical protein T310_2138 [Rasamsonia emersonii CBS 393.64]KKA23848.1 hypothetical protein T310_2138 [Rasamsonia emersonii CBS 393.64]